MQKTKEAKQIDSNPLVHALCSSFERFWNILVILVFHLIQQTLVKLIFKATAFTSENKAQSACSWRFFNCL